MPRIPDAELADIERCLCLHGLCCGRERRMLVALREAYQEIDGLEARTAGAMPPGTPAVTTYTPHAPYFYQPRICSYCLGVIVVGIPHGCTAAKP